MHGREKTVTTSDGRICQSVESPVIVSKPGSKEIDTTIASFFMRTAFPSTLLIHPVCFARIIEESMRFAKHNPSQNHKAVPADDYL